MGIFFGANGKKAAGRKRGWKSDKEAVKVANSGTQQTDFSIARARHRNELAAKKRAATKKKKQAATKKKRQEAHLAAARASATRAGKGS